MENDKYSIISKKNPSKNEFLIKNLNLNFEKI